MTAKGEDSRSEMLTNVTVLDLTIWRELTLGGFDGARGVQGCQQAVSC